MENMAAKFCALFPQNTLEKVDKKENNDKKAILNQDIKRQQFFRTLRKNIIQRFTNNQECTYSCFHRFRMFSRQYFGCICSDDKTLLLCAIQSSQLLSNSKVAKLRLIYHKK